jgi:hypothetical protein
VHRHCTVQYKREMPSTKLVHKRKAHRHPIKYHKKSLASSIRGKCMSGIGQPHLTASRGFVHRRKVHRHPIKYHKIIYQPCPGSVDGWEAEVSESLLPPPRHTLANWSSYRQIPAIEVPLRSVVAGNHAYRHQPGYNDGDVLFLWSPKDMLRPGRHPQQLARSLL